ncbi:MAG: indole-3-glycerol phosphate synthase TrpC [Luteibacter sp.]|jgi:indole-3-glycerol phosphate synthase|uniref:indole-3-glycerol phosphate synthase TrpC n=1 Tax=Luteibacter TaxID=242605 RepID=UPI000562491E|nr:MULTISPECIES: indole-3-glycerol phosphate synthase TrpC [unclassified Luteibacter]MDQ7994493.1 indole-3-glycerol phosphate synthase TrpC [Luteibacter sp.]MDQ8050636.1 indole-3-glycerol phosphate synthase TrpC [Luteibacter sp.]MDR6642012.1 indole-3-glycerol phosphate synthase [Luteibacter sp. 1214]
MPDILHRILDRKAEEVAERKRKRSLDDLAARIAGLEPTRGFVAAIDAKLHDGHPAVIAEIKKASPSKGLIRADFNPAEIARSYENGGAACLSVLTDADFFQGHEDFVREARDACSLPILRKDFIVDEYQVYEARVIGADCILLIVAAFASKENGDVIYDDKALLELSMLAAELDLDVLVEVHNEDELEIALDLPVPLIGVNNRNLRTFETSLGTSLRLKDRVGDGTLVAESGIHTPEDVKILRDKGIDCFLVGEAFMRAADPGAELRKLFGTASQTHKQ